MKLIIRNIVGNNVRAIKSLVNTTFGALPAVEQVYLKKCDNTDRAEGYAVIYKEYYSAQQSRDDRKQELCERPNPYDQGTMQFYGFRNAQAALKRDDLCYGLTRPTLRYGLQYEVEAVGIVLMVRFAHNLALAYTTAEFSLEEATSKMAPAITQYERSQEQDAEFKVLSACYNELAASIPVEWLTKYDFNIRCDAAIHLLDNINNGNLEQD